MIQWSKRKKCRRPKSHNKHSLTIHISQHPPASARSRLKQEHLRFLLTLPFSTALANFHCTLSCTTLMCGRGVSQSTLSRVHNLLHHDPPRAHSRLTKELTSAHSSFLNCSCQIPLHTLVRKRFFGLRTFSRDCNTTTQTKRLGRLRYGTTLSLKKF